MSATIPTLLAALAGALAPLAGIGLARQTLAALASPFRSVGARLLESMEQAIRPFRLAGEHGVLPTDRERLRLQGLTGLSGAVAGVAIAGAAGAVVAGIGAAWLAARVLVWRRERYRRRVDSGAALVALALADALAAGHSIRGALGVAANGTGGPIGRELRAVGRELEMGGRTADALTGLRGRCRSRRIDLVVAAIQLQRRSGGALAALLREIAATIEDQERLHDEARAASAQARFTSIIVAMLPPFGVLLGELASPGFVGRLAGSALGLWLVGAAVSLQAGGLVLIARFGRVEA